MDSLRLSARKCLLMSDVKCKKKLVAVVVPVYREELSLDEEISIKHLKRYLVKYDVCVVAPHGLKMGFLCQEFLVKYFPEKNFKSMNSYSQMLLSEIFYKVFLEYEFILIYQLDSLVFSDKLLEWCERGYDYIGAPWYRTETLKSVNWAPESDSVGNGGFSLRRVETHRRLAKKYNGLFERTRRKLNCLKSLLVVLINAAKQMVRCCGGRISPQEVLCNVMKSLRGIDQQKHEDYVWCFEIKGKYPEYKIASVGDAVSFSFETGPQYCFKKNNFKLPFGCHAWARYDRLFWEPYLLSNESN